MARFSRLPIIGVIDRTVVLTPEGVMREGAKRDCIVFGPTCDSIDRLPGEMSLASDIAEGDYVMFGRAWGPTPPSRTRASTGLAS